MKNRIISAFLLGIFLLLLTCLSVNGNYNKICYSNNLNNTLLGNRWHNDSLSAPSSTEISYSSGKSWEYSKLPGKNVYENGFKRCTDLTYDDVASVSDDYYTFAIGTYFDEKYFKEKLKSLDHLSSTLNVNGCYEDWTIYSYDDIELQTTHVNPIICDYSFEHIYLGRVILKTDRFETARGIHVGSTTDELFKAYNTDGYNNVGDFIMTDGEKSYYGLEIDAVMLKFYFNPDSERITLIDIYM